MARTIIKASDRYSLRKLGIDYTYWVYKNKRINYRWKKKLVRDIFRMWHKTTNADGVYNEDYWKMLLEDGTKVRTFLFNNMKALTPGQSVKFFDTIFEHKKLNYPNQE